MTTRAAPHWIVHTHHRMRTVSFACSFLVIGAHLWGKDYGAVAWSLLVFQFLVYPHLVFWRARRAADSLRAELDNLALDSLLVGIWIAAIAFPVWIAFTLFMSTSLNLAITEGRRGIFAAMLAFSGGVLISILAGGFRWSPHTDWLVTLLCIVGLSVYLLTIGNVAHVRNKNLRETRGILKGEEQALLATNDVLRRQLDEIHQLQEKLREQANRDPLTGLYNRRYLDDALELEVARCRRSGRPLCLAMIDLDHFKRINDIHGHNAGDEALRRTARTLEECVRVTDTCGRWGGEEFICLLPEAELAGGHELAERMRHATASQSMQWHGRPLAVTVSIGLAMLREGETVGAFVARADAALYRAKEAGRDRVMVADD